MMNMKKWTNAAALVLSVLALAAAVTALVIAARPAEQPSSAEDVQYVMYVGTNDKDTNEPVLPPEEARAKAQEILLRHLGGYTIQEANGGWIDGEKVYTEYTMVIYMSDTVPEKVHAVGDEMISAFHQSSVLIQANQTRTEFYSGQ
jgi:hypothetical protein